MAPRARRARLSPRVLLAAAVALAGCSFNYEPATVAEKLGEIPDSVLQTFSQTVVRDGKPLLRLEADEARTYRTSERVLLSGARFQEYDSRGELAVEGSAENGVFHTDTENAEFSGRIVLYSARDKATVRASSLEWDRKRRLLSAGGDGAVVLERDDGSHIEGHGFEADFRTHSLRFTAGAGGVVVTGEGASSSP
jgi:LPS export ABC transporter protein LptC